MLTPEGSAVQGWGEAVATEPGRLHAPALQGNQDYVTWVYTDRSTEPWMVKHLPVSPGPADGALSARCRSVLDAAQCSRPPGADWTSSTSTPPALLGWMKFTRDPAVPVFGSS